MNIRSLALVALAAALAAGNACSNEKATKDDSPAKIEAPPAQEAIAQPAAGDTFAGKVVETMDAGTYTYVRVASGDPRSGPPPAAEVAVEQVEVPLTCRWRTSSDT
jgi:hypothetical protein